jgi:glycosyltransferase involved in cell wall biosynthesis
MSGGPATLARRTFAALARKILFYDRLRRELDALSAENAGLLSERNDLTAALGRAEAERWQAIRACEQAEAARWKAVRDREQAETARGQAVRARERAERARFHALQPQLGFEEARPPAFEAQERRAAAGAPAGRNSPNGETALAIEAAAKKVRTNGDGRGTTSAGAMKISVLLPNYNHGAFIKQNIEAVRAQTYRDWELVIVDDGSTDDSAATIRALAELDRRIVPIFLPTNRGVMFAVQAGLAATTGDLFYGSAADDHIVNAQFFERVTTALTEHPEVSGVFGRARVIDPSSSETLWEMGSSPAHGLVSPRQALETFFTGGLFVPGAAAIWRRADIDALGGFDEDLGPQSDYFLNHALPAISGAVFVDEVFAAVRADTGNYHRSAAAEEFFRRHAMVESKLRAHLAAPPDPNWVHVWRHRIIESRLATTRQRRFFDSVRETLDGIEPWERASLSVGFIDCSSRVLADVNQLEHDLDREISFAYRTFDAVAGMLPPEDSPPGLPPS